MTIDRSCALNRHVKHPLRLIVGVVIAVLATSLLSSAIATDTDSRTVTVRVINSKNGKRLKNVFVALTGPAGGFIKNHDGKVVAGTTNKLGEVTLELPPPVWERLGVSYTGGGTCHLVQCSRAQTYGIAEILKTGTVAINKCSSALKHQYNVVPKPGELIIFAEPYTGWQCAMQEVP